MDSGPFTYKQNALNSVPGFVRLLVFGCFIQALLLTHLSSAAEGYQPVKNVEHLFSGFTNPPADSKPFMWWHWMNGNVSQAGITSDLEAMKAIGAGGVILFDEGDRIEKGQVDYASDEYFENVAYSAAECERLGLEFGFHNCPGWSSTGGPWITPEHAMKYLTWSATVVESGVHGQKLVLSQPSTHVDPYDLPERMYRPSDYYRDIVVIAFPTPDNPQWRVRDWEKKSGLYNQLSPTFSIEQAPADTIINKDTIVVLHDKLDKDGTLNWTPPPGKWTLLRFGYTLTGHLNHAPPDGGKGLDCDKLSKAAIDFHWKHFMHRYIDSARHENVDSLKTVLIDSYETLTQTWTQKMPEEFLRRRGYDILPYLLCMTGRPVNSLIETERFYWDFRKTIEELITEYYYVYFANKLQEEGLKIAIESYGYDSLFNDLTISKVADIPMGEFWNGLLKYHHWSSKTSASGADLMGRNIVGAEAYTSGGQRSAWSNSPFSLKAQGDYFLTHGVTRFYFQASAHQPFPDPVKPGMTMGPHGIQMNRNNTWWKPASAWMDYLSRCQYLLQQGTLVTDFCYYTGENMPISWRVRGRASSDRYGIDWEIDQDEHPSINVNLPDGRDFHIIDTESLLEAEVDENGNVILPYGNSYKVLVLPDDQHYRSRVLAKIYDLLISGATLVGSPTGETPSLGEILSNKISLDSKQWIRRIWGDVEPGSKSRLSVGKGYLYSRYTIEEVFEELDLPPDFEVKEAENENLAPEPEIRYIHRQLEDDAEIYFISNQRYQKTSLNVYFRIDPQRPAWILDPVSGGISRLRAQRFNHLQGTDRTMMQMVLEPAQSTFIIFGNGKLEDNRFTRMTEKVPAQNLSPVISNERHTIDLSTGWRVAFQQENNITYHTKLDELISWTELEDDGLKYFSGTATYTKTVRIDPKLLEESGKIVMDLGKVAVISEVEVNDCNLGTVWTAPFECDLTSVLRPGKNTIRIAVTNLWVNRLIQDAKLRNYTEEDSKNRNRSFNYTVPEWVWKGKRNPADNSYIFTTYQFYHKNSELVESGLLGPVEIQFFPK